LAPWILEHLNTGKAKAGDPVDPMRFNEFDLVERELSYGRTGFALQFMLDTSLSDAEKYPLRLSDLIITNIHAELAPIRIQYGSGPQQMIEGIPLVGLAGDRLFRPLFVDKEWRPYQGAVMTIDPSGRGKDETAWAVTKMIHGNIWLPDAGGFPGGYDAPTLSALVLKAKQHRVNEILVESNFGDGMFSELLKPYMEKMYPCTLNEVHHTGQKELRIIDVMEPVMNQHRLIVDEELVRRDAQVENPNYQLFYQLTRLTRDRHALPHEDKLEAVSMGISYWIEHMAKDQDKAAKEFRDAKLDAELRKFMEQVVGFKKPKDSTLDLCGLPL
jgi:hypothetical protein